MSTLFTWTTRIMTALVALAALFVLGSLVPIEGNYSFRIVESGSMEPAIKTGSVIAIVPRAAYEVGDVVTFLGTEINPQPTTHRIVDIDGDRFVTKGDANEDVDYRQVHESEIIGKVFLDVPYAGYTAEYFGTPSGKGTLAAIVGTLIIAMCIPWRKLQKENNENA